MLVSSRKLRGISYEFPDDSHGLAYSAINVDMDIAYYTVQTATGPAIKRKRQTREPSSCKT
jgi:hypothetical protein